jgi:hypothetical protein
MVILARTIFAVPAVFSAAGGGMVRMNETEKSYFL